jgi:hypothetical protein
VVVVDGRVDKGLMLGCVDGVWDKRAKIRVAR